jgi:monofunctional chorismate mutase
MQAIRGAITVGSNTAVEILQQTQALLETMLSANQIDKSEVISVFFTATPDLNAAFPARAARTIGLTQAALMDAVEMDVPGAMPRTIRILMFIDRLHQPHLVRHVYMGEAKRLRPDLALN